MSLLATIAIGTGLAMDAFAVSIAGSVSLGQVSPRQVFRFAWHFGLFQAMMPAIGWAIGRNAGAWVNTWDHWIAFGLLSFVGVKAILEALAEKEPDQPRGDPTRGMTLVALSVATSLDALAVGLSFAVMNVPVLYPCLIIGVITGGLSTVGMLIGSRLGLRFGKTVEILGGLLLIGIGAKILIEGLVA